MFLSDYHSHSLVSFDGEFPMSDMAQAAMDAGLNELCITDHCDFLDQDGVPVRTYDWAKALDQFESAAPFHSREGFSLRLGLELGMPYLDSAAAERICSQPLLDFVLGSVHNLSPERGGTDFYYADYSTAAACREALDDHFASLALLAETDFYDVLAHIIYPLRYMKPDDGPVTLEGYEDRLEALLRTAIGRGKGMEVNTWCGRTLADWLPMLKLYRSLGGEIVTVGSDAHAPGNVGKGVPQAFDLLREAGFRYVTVFRRRKPEFIPII